MEYTIHTTVDGSLCDEKGRMRPSYILRIAQEISGQHCDSLGLGRADLLKKDMLFLLAKLKLTVKRTPKENESLTVTTRPFSPVRFAYPRFTDIYGENGDELVHLDSRWILVDTASFRILREVPDFLDIFPDLPKEAGDFRVPRRADYEKLYDLPVRYSMIDKNGHMNNAVYADVITDAVGEKIRAGGDISSMIIAYHKEVMFGQILCLELSSEGGTDCIRGMLPDGTPCFESLVEQF